MSLIQTHVHSGSVLTLLDTPSWSYNPSDHPLYGQEFTADNSNFVVDRAGRPHAIKNQSEPGAQAPFRAVIHDAYDRTWRIRKHGDGAIFARVR